MEGKDSPHSVVLLPHAHTMEHGNLTHMHMYIYISNTQKLFLKGVYQEEFPSSLTFSVCSWYTHLFILPFVSLRPLLALLSLISQHILFLHQNPAPVSPTPELPLVLSAFNHCVCCSILLWWGQGSLDMWHLKFEKLSS